MAAARPGGDEGGIFSPVRTARDVTGGNGGVCNHQGERWMRGDSSAGAATTGDGRSRSVIQDGEDLAPTATAAA